MTVGLAMVTMNRPAYAEKCIKAIRKHLTGVVDEIVVVNDGSDPKYNGEYRRVEKATQTINGMYIACDENGGVAKAKNVGLRWLLNKGCDDLFVIEEDILVTSPKAITGYLAAAKQSGLSHLSYAWHGPANLQGPILTTTFGIEYFTHAIGAFCYYTAEALDDVGLLDENFCNAWEHVSHSLDLAVAGYTSGPYKWADAIGSQNWLTEIPGSIDKSSIRPRPDWSANIRNGLIYWRDEKPDTFKLMFGEEAMLHNWAKGIIGEP